MSSTAPRFQLVEVPLANIEPDPEQPRKNFANLDSLKESIGAKGVQVPIIIRPVGGGRFRIVAGERRFRASRELGLESIPAVVSPLRTNEEIKTVQLIENLQRESLNPIEEARSIDQILKTKQTTAEQLAKSLGMAPSNVSQVRSILKLEKDIPEGLQTSEQFAAAKSVLIEIARHKSATTRRELLRKLASRGLTVREARAHRGPYESRMHTRIYSDRDLKVIVRTSADSASTTEQAVIARAIALLQSHLA